MSYSLYWLADVLRAAGLKVAEQPGWKERGRAEMGPVRGILCHHTGGSLKGNAPTLDLVQNGRPDLAGPLSQVVLGRDGTWILVAAGRCNHAGAGEWHGITSGNTNFIGIEAENAGTTADPWPQEQMQSYAAGCAAIARHLGLSSHMVVGHKEYALPRGRKIDPTFDMVHFRENVAHILSDAPEKVIPVPTVSPSQAMLSLGSRGNDVKIVQAKLGITPDGEFGPKTEAAVKEYQRANGLTDDGRVGPKTWLKLGT